MVKNYIQQCEVNFDSTFVNMIKSMAFRVPFIIAIYFDFDIDKIDVKICFLYEQINQFIYIEMSKKTKIEVNKNKIYKLLKVLYKFKQLSRLWYRKLSVFLLEKLELKYI